VKKKSSLYRERERGTEKSKFFSSSIITRIWQSCVAEAGDDSQTQPGALLNYETSYRESRIARARDREVTGNLLC